MVNRLSHRWLLAAYCLFPGAALAQDPGAAAAPPAGDPIVIGRQVVLASDALREDRPIWIHTPQAAGAIPQRFPVLYVLDGRTHFEHVVGIVDFMATVGLVPPMIVVGVPNVSPPRRTRDLTPKPTHQYGADGVTPWRQLYPDAGGAEDFLEFLTDELVPYIDSTHPTVPLRILVGHSFGGLFNVYAFLEQPSVFRGHIVISPSLWWDQQHLVVEADRFLRDEQPAGFLHVTTGNEGGAMLASATDFADLLAAEATDSLRWKFTHMERESHGTIPHRSTYDGLEWMFEPWRFTPADGAAFAAAGRVAAIDRRFADISSAYGFAMRPSEPFLNAVGYTLLRRGAAQEAIVIFAENAARFPNSANVYDSLADAHLAAGDLLLARDNYARAWRLAEATGHPNTAYYKQNLDRVNRQLTSN